MKRVRAFSLFEVIIAVGLFGGTVAVVLGLVGLLSRQVADSADAIAAQRLPGPVKAELSRLAGTSLDNLAAQIPPMAGPLDNGLMLVASRDSARVQSLAYLPPVVGQIPASDQYYLVECWRFSAEPLSFDGQKAFLALHVRVSWPYRVPGAASAVPLAARSEITFTVSLNR